VVDAGAAQIEGRSGVEIIRKKVEGVKVDDDENGRRQRDKLGRPTWE
jgi:hypothetical protein